MRTIYFLSLLFVFAGIRAATGAPQIVEAKYALDINSSWSVSDLNTKPFLLFNKSKNLNLGYNTNANVWCVFKIKNTDVLHSQKTWL